VLQGDCEVVHPRPGRRNHEKQTAERKERGFKASHSIAENESRDPDRNRRADCDQRPNPLIPSRDTNAGDKTYGDQRDEQESSEARRKPGVAKNCGSSQIQQKYTQQGRCSDLKIPVVSERLARQSAQRRPEQDEREKQDGEQPETPRGIPAE